MINKFEPSGNLHLLIGAGSYGAILASELSTRCYAWAVIVGGIQLLFGIYGRHWSVR